MGINLGAGFENLNGNSSISNQSAGILNLNKNDILDLTKRNPGLKKVSLGAGWDIANNGLDYDLDIAAFLLDSNNKFNTVSNINLPSAILSHLFSKAQALWLWLN